MIRASYIEIETLKFQKYDNEESEMINEGMYGKKLSIYLQTELSQIGYKVPFYCCEDWGWWVSVENLPISFGLCIYGWGDGESPIDKYLISSSVKENRKWSWGKFSFIKTQGIVDGVMADLEKIFGKDKEITAVRRHDEFPW